MPNLQDYFQFRSYYAVSNDTAKSKYYFIESTDLNGDGNKDVIFLGATYPIGSNTDTQTQAGMFYWGSTNYQYKLSDPQSLLLPSSVHPREVAYADFNNDGKLDIFIADHGWDTNPFPGGQNQLILSGSTGWTNATSNLPQHQDFTHSTAVGDVNNDGFIDIFVGNIYSQTTPFASSFLLGDGKGNFSESTTILPNEIKGKDAIRSTAVILSDLNNDGWLDLIFGNDGNQNNSKSQTLVYWNDRGVYSNVHSSLIPNGYFGKQNEQILDIQSGDLDGDGIKEIVLLSTQQKPFYDGWSLQTVRVSGEQIADFTASAFGSNIYKMGQPNQSTTSPWIPFLRLTDVNSDGTLDILFDGVQMGSGIDQGAMPLIYLNDGFAHFTPIFARDILKDFPEKDIGTSFNSFFNLASSFS